MYLARGEPGESDNERRFHHFVKLLWFEVVKRRGELSICVRNLLWISSDFRSDGDLARILLSAARRRVVAWSAFCGSLNGARFYLDAVLTKNFER